jgi:hypothetical protein
MEDDTMSNSMPTDPNYYTARKKVIRDIVHEYIHVTAFENSLIDTLEFQRLRDIKQVTASYVFPNANHTRFEHSLGTFELTRKAMEAVKSNGLFIDENDFEIHQDIEASTLIAALLHDIGHSPFSHLGEKQFKEGPINESLKKAFNQFLDAGIAPKLLDKGATHEKLSCLVIIKNMWNTHLKNAHDNKVSGEISLDLEHICRCILGIPYGHSGDLPKYVKPCEENLRICNFCVNLVNCKIFDMDSLDYIMRDTMYFALNSSKIDIQRLFSNMFIGDDGSPIFKRQAVSVLKDIIDEKNNDYLNAVNHHTTIYFNFLYEFIFRRFKNDKLYDMDEFFSEKAVLELRASDSDVWAMLKRKHLEYKEQIKNNDFNNDDEKKNITERADELLTNLFSREFLKPFWKDVMEFELFKKRHFKRKVLTFERICTYVCTHSKAEIFRSEVVPVIVHLANEVNEKARSKMPKKLKGHELFLVEAQQKWLDRANVDTLKIYLRKNEVRNTTRFGGESPYKYEAVKLSEVMPLAEHSELYTKNAFYVYVKPFEPDNQEVEQTYYDNLERVIVITLSYFADKHPMEINHFLSICDDKNEKLRGKSKKEKEKLLEKFKEEIWERVKTELQID